MLEPLPATLMTHRPIHPDFLRHPGRKDQTLIDRFSDLRSLVIELHPDANEMLCHTHALTSVFSITEKLGDPPYGG